MFEISYILKICDDSEIYSFNVSTQPIRETKNISLLDNVPYTITLFEDEKEIPFRKLFINGEEVDSAKKRNTFEGYYGWVKISAETADSTFSTGYISVMPKNKDILNQIYKMIEYIVDRSKKIEFPDSVNDLFGISTSGKNTNFKTEDLLNHILKEYEQNFRHFFNNSRAKLSEVKSVDSIEKLRGFSRDTARFMVTHPQYLAEAKDGPVSFKDKLFSPLKTLVSSNKKSFNIYENQVVLGFLKHVIEWNANSEDTLSFKDYFHLANEGKKLEFIDRAELQKKLRLIYDRYKNIFGNIDDVSVDVLPTMTHIFKNVNHYQNLYKYMRMFFVGGIISPSEENAVRWYLDTSSKIYEYFVFLKLDEEISKNYERKEIRPSVGSDFLPEYICYEKGNEKKYLYFKPEIPFIHSQGFNHGINLQRFTTVSFYTDKESTKEYTPDYIIKTVDEAGNETYEIADAKFSDYNTVREYYMPPAVFKYLASVEAINDAKISGLTLYYCKGDKKEQVEPPTIKNPDVKIEYLF